MIFYMKIRELCSEIFYNRKKKKFERSVCSNEKIIR